MSDPDETGADEVKALGPDIEIDGGVIRRVPRTYQATASTNGGRYGPGWHPQPFSIDPATGMLED